MSSPTFFGRLPRTAASNHRGQARRRRPGFRPRLEALEDRLVPATFFVTNGGDNGGINPAPGAGTGTLRQAIIDADNTPGPDVLKFNIATSGVQTIQPLAALPTIGSSNITIDGTTEGGYSGTPVIVLDGTKAGRYVDGLDIFGDACTVEGLAIVHFAGAGIAIGLGDNNTVKLDYIGTSDGVNPAGNGSGVSIVGASNNTVGAVGAGNVISGNSGDGIDIVAMVDLLSTGDQVLANFIGTTADGSHPLPNGGFGVHIDGGASNTIGGTAAGAGNVISGNHAIGVLINGSGTTGNKVLANLIGTTADAGHPLGNTGDGVHIEGAASNNTIGGAGAGNLIAYNGSAGVVVGFTTDDNSAGNTMSQNAIFGNAGLGIDLGNDGVTPNSPGGPHTGPNHLQNYPVLTPYTTPGTLTGTLNSTPNTTFVLEFFANPAPDPSGHGQGQDHLGSAKVTTNAAGNAPFVFSYLAFPGEPYLSATATNATTGDTSEFSATVGAALTPTGLTLAATEGAPFSGVVATFAVADTNATPASFTASIAWGDDTVTPGKVVYNPGGGFAVTGSHTYGEEASALPVAVTIIDVPANAQATAHSLINVADAPLTAVSTLPVCAVEGAKFSGQLGTFFDPNPGEPLSDYTVTIAWGDGSSSPGSVTALGNGLFAVNGTHPYGEEGKYTFSWLVQDAGGATATGSGKAKVADAPFQGTGKSLALKPPIFTFSGMVATFTDADPGGVLADYTATIDWGDGTTGPGTIGFSNGVFTVSGSHAYKFFFGTRKITITITDLGGSITTVVSTIQFVGPWH
jgi:hypothetical protein